MSYRALPPVLESILSSAGDPEEIFALLLPALGRTLRCDRCFLYLRDPETSMGRVAYCWISSPAYPTIFDPDWKPEPATLSQEDPLFAAALRAEASIYIEDVETADPSLLNQEFEQHNFGHRALIHAHLVWQGQLWGILQPAIFGQPRVWADFDHTVISQVEKRLAPLAATYVKEQFQQHVT